jgi:uncharacterized membrane protein YhaH (DUF805 family)
MRGDCVNHPVRLKPSRRAQKKKLEYTEFMTKLKKASTFELSLMYLKNYFIKGFDFKSKIARKEYFVSQLLALLFIFVVFFISTFIGEFSAIAGQILGFVSALFLVLALWCQLPLSVRRLRDAGFNPWWVLIAILPFGGLALFIMHCQPSKKLKVSK